jgi:hypothetical protein
MQKPLSFPLLFRLGIIIVVLLGTLAAGTTQFIRFSKAASAVASSPIANTSETRAYWTPERRKAATSAPMSQGSSPSAHSTQQAPSSNSGNRLLSASTQHAPNSNSMPARSAAVPVPALDFGTLPVRTIGKIFYYDTFWKENKTCTGTVIMSNNGRVVDTAGRCVHEYGAWHTLWEFCPQYQDGNSPYGCWAANQLFVAPGWTDWTPLAGNNPFASNFGMAVLEPLNGQTIQSVVGSMDWKPNIQDSILDGLSAIAYGFSDSPPSNGEQMYSVTGRLSFVTFSSGYISMRLANYDMGSGGIGGPWFVTYPDEQILIGHTGIYDSPRLNDEWLTLLNVAQSAPNVAP